MPPVNTPKILKHFIRNCNSLNSTQIRKVLLKSTRIPQNSKKWETIKSSHMNS